MRCLPPMRLVEGDDKLIEKCGKLSKTGKLSKFQKSAKLRKKLSKNENIPNFDANKNRPSFLIPNAKMAFNHLRLVFTKILILWHFDPEYYIWIETDASGYAIGGIQSKLASKTRPDKIVTKTNLSQWHPVVFFWKKWFL